MFCVKCGHALEDGDAFCANCGVPIKKTYIPEEEESSDLDLANVPEKPKSGRKLLLMIGAGVVVLAAVVALLLNLGAIKGWFVRTVSSPEELMAAVYKTSAAQMIPPIMQSYEATVGAMQAEEFSGGGQIVLKPRQQLLDILAYAVYGGEGDMSWLSDIRLDASYTRSGKLQKNEIGLGLGEQDVVNAELITDMEHNKLYIAVPELHEQALLTDVDTTSSDMTQLYDAMPSAETVSRIAGQYLDILLGGFSNVEKKSDTLSLDGVSQDVTVLEAYMDHVDLIEVMIAILEQIRQDPDVKAILEGLDPWYNDMLEQSMSAYYDAFGSEYVKQELYAELTAQINAALAQLREELSNADPENHLYLYTYLDDSNSIVGSKLTVSGMEEPVSYLTLTQEGQFSTQILFGNLQINGSGMVSTGLNGSYEVLIDGEKLLDIKLENVTQSAGVICMEPTAVLLTDLAGEMGIDAGLVTMADIMICISFEEDDEKAKTVISILSNESALLEIYISGSTTDAQQVIVPENAVDSGNEEAAVSWLMGLDLEGLMANLLKAGLPEELFAALLLEQ